MILFEYKYTPSSEILKNIKLVIDFSIIEFISLLFIIILIILFVYYIIPAINLYFEYTEKQRLKLGKKELLKQIVMQKDINDKIEKELDL